MRDRVDEFGQDTDVVLVTFTNPEDAAWYRAAHGTTFPILMDPSRRTYRAYGLGRGSRRRVYGWRAGARYLKIVGRDGWSGLRRPTEDTLQLGGDFVVGPDGTLVFGFWGEGPDDRPDVAELVDAVAGVGP